LILGVEFLLGLLMIGILGDTVHRTDLYALGSLIVSHTLGAQVGIDLIDLVTLGNRAVRALGLTYIAVDAFIGDD
jgi:hypothetical protein